MLSIAQLELEDDPPRWCPYDGDLLIHDVCRTCEADRYALCVPAGGM